ncbi:hypothetical protein [Actinomadura keratinilytica]|uniref:hypothetical protein n=1 Tax=Actinomadura keratinilytica TaxID=547461 RepID=UPI00361D46D3
MLMAVDVSAAMDAPFPDADGTRRAAAKNAIALSRRLMGDATGSRCGRSPATWTAAATTARWCRSGRPTARRPTG